jgi:hypothetical protein
MKAATFLGLIVTFAAVFQTHGRADDLKALQVDYMIEAIAMPAGASTRRQLAATAARIISRGSWPRESANQTP